jgi:aminopeptidase N
MDKWFATQASLRPIAQVKALLEDPDFKWTNPNRFRSVFTSFTSNNLGQFHSINGQGYRLVGDAVLKVDKFNHQVAARLAQAFSTWHRYDFNRQDMMKAQLTRFVNEENVSKELYEVATKSLKK